jgi:heat shock protein HslJ
MKMKIVLTLLASLVLISGCGFLAAKDPLSGTKWQLRNLGDAEPIPGSVVTIEFADQRMSGSAGCNSYGAGYEIDGDRLVFDAIAMTEMACADDTVMQQESKFTQLLGQVMTYKLFKDELALSDKGGNVLMTFGPKP